MHPVFLLNLHQLAGKWWCRAPCRRQLIDHGSLDGISASCRTLPGQGAARRIAFASGVTPGIRRNISRDAFFKKCVDEGGDMSVAIAQRWDLEGNDVEAIEQVGAESTGADFLWQVSLGGSR